MKLKFERINKFDKKTKIFGIITITLLIFGILFQIFKTTFSIGDEPYLANQTIENLEFANATLNYENNITIYKVEVTNSLTEEYNLNTINIIFKDSEGKEIENLIGYIGNSLEGKETKILEASVDKEIKDIKTIEYVINK